MVKVLPIIKRLQIIKKYIRQPDLNFQKYYRLDQNMIAGGQRLYNRTSGQGLNKCNSPNNGQMY